MSELTAAEQAAKDEADRAAALAHVETLAAGQTEDFDEFWATTERKAHGLDNVFGQRVVLPPSLPLKFEVKARAAQESKDEKDTKELVGILFGAGALDAWTEKGMDLEQFSVLLMWGTANTRQPGSMTLREARDIFQSRSESSGKEETAPATRSGAASRATGARSKRTSAGSTASTRRRSQA